MSPAASEAPSAPVASSAAGSSAVPGGSSAPVASSAVARPRPRTRASGSIHVTKYASGGGAERIAYQLYRGLQDRGHRSWLATAKGAPGAPGDADDPTILAIPTRGRTATSPAGPCSGASARARTESTGATRRPRALQQRPPDGRCTAPADLPGARPGVLRLPGDRVDPGPSAGSARPRPLPQPPRRLLRPSPARADERAATGGPDPPRRMDLHRALRLHARLRALADGLRLVPGPRRLPGDPPRRLRERTGGPRRRSTPAAGSSSRRRRSG